MMTAVNAKQLNDLEERLERLRVLYEQYFLGIEKREPIDERTKLARDIRIASETFSPNVAVRFRAQNLKSRLITYEQYWTRTIREIESGTYRRQRFQNAIRAKAEAEAAATPRKVKPTGHVEIGGEHPFASVIEEYRRIQREAGQAQVDPAKLAETLRRQESQLREKFGVKSIEFRVVLEDGKPKLKAKPIK